MSTDLSQSPAWAALRAHRSALGSTTMRDLFAAAPCTTFNVGTLHGGTASNMIAERCDLTLSYRPPPLPAPFLSLSL